MLRTTLVAVSALASVAAGPAHAQIPPLQPALVQTLATACTAEAGFGRRFGEVWTGSSYADLPEAEPMPNRVEVTRTQRSQRVFRVAALVSYERLPGSAMEERYAAAQALYDAVGEAVVSEGRLLNPRDGEYGSIIWDVPDSKVTMELSYAGGVGMDVTCTDTGLEAEHVREAFGEGPAQRPLKPALALPQRAEPGSCDDPASAETVRKGYVGLAMEAMDYSAGASRYSEQMADWWGQQLVEAGAWSEAQKDAFALRAAHDPEIARELGEQLPRAQGILEVMMAFVEADDAGDAPAACAAAVEGLGIVYAIVDSNERQWARMHGRYRAEATRLGVTLQD